MRFVPGLIMLCCFVSCPTCKDIGWSVLYDMNLCSNFPSMTAAREFSDSPCIAEQTRQVGRQAIDVVS